MSMHATSFPGNLSWSVGTVATGLAAVDWIAALGLVPALLAWHAARMRRATIAPIAPFRGVRCILVLLALCGPCAWAARCRCNLLLRAQACRGQTAARLARECIGESASLAVSALLSLRLVSWPARDVQIPVTRARMPSGASGFARFPSRGHECRQGRLGSPNIR